MLWLCSDSLCKAYHFAVQLKEEMYWLHSLSISKFMSCYVIFVKSLSSLTSLLDFMTRTSQLDPVTGLNFSPKALRIELGSHDYVISNIRADKYRWVSFTECKCLPCFKRSITSIDNRLDLLMTPITSLIALILNITHGFIDQI